MSATIPSVAVPGLKNVLLEDDDFALVYCAACRKDALDVRTGKLHKDDLCIVDCCQAGPSTRLFGGEQHPTDLLISVSPLRQVLLWSTCATSLLLVNLSYGCAAARRGS